MNVEMNTTASQSRKRASRNGTIRKVLAGTACAALAGFLAVQAPAQASNTETAAASTEPTTCARTGAIWWNELLAPETDRLTEFYAKVMGWNTKIVDAEDQSEPARTPDDRYTVFMDGQREVAGLMRANHPEAVHTAVGWFTYMQVPDVAAAAAKAAEAGGTILRQPTETAEGHHIAVVSDPMGNVFGLVTPAKKEPC